MKKALLFLIVVSWQQLVFSQNVGIGTNSPHASAQLDVSSTGKGLLIPRLTSTQRMAIAAPANGLLVYETTSSSFWFYNGTVWTQITAAGGTEGWASSSTNIYNTNAGNVGIGISSPTAKLQVAGNIKTSGRIDATGAVEAAGLSSTGVLYVNSTSLLQGAVTGNAAATFSGTITSNTGITINDASAILSLKSAGTDKGFMQLSGDDVRVGTYSSNTNGRFIIRNAGTNQVVVQNDGKTGIGTEAPVAQLQVNSGTSNTTLRLQADGAPSLQFYSGTTSVATIQPAGTNLRIIAAGDYVSLSDVLYADDASNRVGIGTSSPEQKLHVTGNAKLTGGKIFNNENKNIVPVAYGRFNSLSGQEVGTSNFSVVRTTLSNGVRCFILTVQGVDLNNAIINVTPHYTAIPSFFVEANGTCTLYLVGYNSSEADWYDFDAVVYAP